MIIRKGTQQMKVKYETRKLNATPFGGFYDYIEIFEKSPGSQMNLFDQDIYNLRVIVREIVSWEIVLYFN